MSLIRAVPRRVSRRLDRVVNCASRLVQGRASEWEKGGQGRRRLPRPIKQPQRPVLYRIGGAEIIAGPQEETRIRRKPDEEASRRAATTWSTKVRIGFTRSKKRKVDADTANRATAEWAKMCRW